VRPIKDEDLGLQVLYDGGGSAIRIPKPVVLLSMESLLLSFRIAFLTNPSIVAVHGMGAHPDDTWCSNNVNWLID
jgi:hypothetical protein